jgi:hypothetical protein
MILEHTHIYLKILSKKLIIQTRHSISPFHAISLELAFKLWAACGCAVVLGSLLTQRHELTVKELISKHHNTGQRPLIILCDPIFSLEC